MTIADNPNLRANRYPWNRATSAARVHVESFLDLAQRRIEANPDALPFPAGVSLTVLAWLRSRLDTPPPA